MDEENKKEETRAGEPETGAETVAGTGEEMPGAETVAGAGAEQTEEAAGSGEDAVAEAEPAAGDGAAGETTVVSEPAASLGKKKNGLAGLLGGMVALAAVVVGLLASGVVDDTAYRPIAYVKDNNLYVSDVRHDPYVAKEAVSTGESFGYAYLAWGFSPSEDNGRILFQGDVDSNYNYSLYSRSTAPGGETRLVGTGALLYQTDRRGDAVAYVTAEGDLYYVGKGDPVLVATGVDAEEEAFRLSEDGKFLGYRVLGESAYQLLTFSAATGESEVVAENIQSYLFYGQGAYYLDYNPDGTFRLFDRAFAAAEATLVCEAAEGVAVSEERDGLMYLTGGDTIPYAQLIADDCAEADAALTAPRAEDYPDEAEYENALAAYEIKLSRDELRSKMEAGEEADLLSACYWYQNGKSTLISSRAVNASFIGSGAAAVLAAPEEVEPVALSEVATERGVWQAYYLGLTEHAETWVMSPGGEPQRLNALATGFSSLAASADRQVWLYVAADAEGEQQLLADTLAGSAHALPVESSEVEFAPVGHAFVYRTDVVNGVGSLWYDDGNDTVCLAEDADGYFFENDGTGLFYMTGGGTEQAALNYFDGKKSVLVDEGVVYAQSYDNGVMAYLKDYDGETGLSDLYVWQKGKTRLLDSGVSHIYLYE